jgi:hypothetical protein
MKRSAVTKGLAAHLKYYHGACVKRNRHCTAEELSVLVHNSLDHICGCHERCDAAWCYDKKAIEENLSFHPTSYHWLNKQKYPETYQQLKAIFNQYESVEILQYCNHPHNTQTNEVLNQAITNIAPKSVCYSGSISLYSRIAHVIGIHNIGHYHYFAALFTEVGLVMTASLAKFLTKKQDRKVSKKAYERR